MKKILVLRSPESESRPQKLIADSIIAELSKDCVVIDSDRIKLEMEECWAAKKQGTTESVLPASLYKKDPACFYGRDDLLNNVLVQIISATAYIDEVDAIFAVDAEIPILPVLKYIISLTKGKNPPVIGMFHSSSLTPGDLFYTDIYSRSLTRKDIIQLTTDVASLACCDALVVATDYLRNHLLKIFSLQSKSGIMLEPEPSKNIDVRVTGLPVPIIPYDLINRALCKQINPYIGTKIVWAHRVCDAKNINLLYAIALPLIELGYSISIINPEPCDPYLWSDLFPLGIGYEQCSSKEEYYEQLVKANVVLSTATLETFGYCIVEGAMLNCIPVVPRTASYAEMYKEEYTYTLPKDNKDSIEIDKCVKEIDRIIKQAIWNKPPISLNTVLKPEYAKVMGEDGKQAVKNIVDVIQQVITTE